MKQNTMFPSLIQKFISDEELQPLIQLVGYEDTARKLNVKTLIQYLSGDGCGLRVEEPALLRRCWINGWTHRCKLFDLIKKAWTAGL